MIGIDTNILVRYLTNDDAEQSIAVANFFEQYSCNESSIYINNIVLCEVIWVLESGYKYPKHQITNSLKLVLQTPEFAFDNHAIIVKALYEYEQSNGADFSDILISFTNKNHGCETTYSFDKKAIKHSYFQELINSKNNK
jgi:predicted nucleic-acid-binding protein